MRHGSNRATDNRAFEGILGRLSTSTRCPDRNWAHWKCDQTTALVLRNIQLADPAATQPSASRLTLPATTADFAPEDCGFFKLPENLDNLLCGYVSVPLQHQVANSRRIKLATVVIRALDTEEELTVWLQSAAPGHQRVLERAAGQSRLSMTS